MKGYFNREGTTVELRFFVQKEYGCSVEPATEEEFVGCLSCCENSERIKKLIRTLSSDKVYEVGDFAANKGNSMPASVYGYISTYFHTFVLSTGGEYKAKVEIVVDGEVIGVFYNSNSVEIFNT